MRSLRKFLTRLNAMLMRDRMERDLEDEISFHLEMQIREKVEAGMSREEAERAVRREFGRPSAVKEQCRDVRLLVWIETVWQDVRFGARTLLKDPGFTFAAVASIALATSFGAIVFGLFDAALRSLPFPEPERLVMIHDVEIANPEDRQSPKIGAIRRWIESSNTVDEVGWATPYSWDLKVNPVGERLEVWRVQGVSRNIFRLLGAKSRPEVQVRVEDRVMFPGENNLVLTERLWKDRFGASTELLGRRSPVAGRFDPIAGVVRQDFSLERVFPVVKDIVGWWVQDLGGSDENRLDGQVIARLASGSSREQAAAELEAMARAFEGSVRERRVLVEPLSQNVFSRYRHALTVFGLAVGLTLLIVCSNVANLVLSRATLRQREIAARAALGASRLRLIRQITTEGALLAGCGATIGLAAVLSSKDLLTLLVPNSWYPVIDNFRINGNTLAFVAVVAAVCVTAASLFPALSAVRGNLASLMGHGSRHSGGPSRTALRKLLATAQIALSLVLLTQAGLMMRSLEHALSFDRGYNPEYLVTLFVAADDARGAEDSLAIARRAELFFDELLDRTRALPGVQEAGRASSLPAVVHGPAAFFTVVGQPSPNERPLTLYHNVSAGYLETMQVRLISGRLLSAEDVAGAPDVAVVNRTFAAQYLDAENPIGEVIRLAFQDPYTRDEVADRSRRIVGVIEDIHPWRNIRNALAPVVYAPYAQQPKQTASRLMTDLHFTKQGFAVRTTLGVQETVAAFRQIAAELSPNAIVYNARKQTERVQEGVSEERFWSQLLGSCSVAALALSAIGLFSLITYLSNQRLHDFGIRLALGASPKDIRALVMRESSALVGLGLSVGTVSAFASAKVLESRLFGVPLYDPTAFAVAIAVLGLAAWVAGYIPARRATKVDPLTILRHE